METPEECMKKALEIATTIAEKSPVAIATCKKSLIYSRDHTVQEGLAHIGILNSAAL